MNELNEIASIIPIVKAYIILGFISYGIVTSYLLFKYTPLRRIFRRRYDYGPDNNELLHYILEDLRNIKRKLKIK